MSIDQGLTQVSDKMVSVATSTLDRTTSRRGFLVRASVVGAALVVSPLRFLLRPGSAFAYATSCTSCGSGLCKTSNNSAFCCSLTNGTNDCPANTDPCGWWRCCIPTSYCSSGYKYFIDCCGCASGEGRCAHDACGYRKICCYPQSWSNCTPTHTGNIRCRIVRCVNPGTLFSNCTTQILTENTCCQGSEDPGCAGTVAGPHPNCCDTCSAC